MKKENLTPEEKERRDKARLKTSAILNTISAGLFALSCILNFINKDNTDNYFGCLYGVLALVYAILSIKSFRELDQ